MSSAQDGLVVNHLGKTSCTSKKTDGKLFGPDKLPSKRISSKSLVKRKSFLFDFLKFIKRVTLCQTLESHVIVSKGGTRKEFLVSGGEEAGSREGAATFWLGRGRQLCSIGLKKIYGEKNAKKFLGATMPLYRGRTIHSSKIK